MQICTFICDITALAICKVKKQIVQSIFMGAKNLLLQFLYLKWQVSDWLLVRYFTLLHVYTFFIYLIYSNTKIQYMHCISIYIYCISQVDSTFFRGTLTIKLLITYRFKRLKSILDAIIIFQEKVDIMLSSFSLSFT